MLQRSLTKTVREVDATFPVLLVTGPRQVGKTTLLKMCAEQNRNYVTLDDLQEREIAQNDPVLFLQAHKPPLLIDEVQYAPQLFSAIKIIADREQKSGLFWLTGSQKFHLMKGITESLAGRVAIIDLLGLSQAEIDGRHDKTEPFLPTLDWINSAKKNMTKPKPLIDVYERIWLGAFPKLTQDPKISSNIFYNSYIKTYIQRDIRDILNISDEIAFSKFLSVVAARTGQLLNYSNLARDVDIDHKTAKAWLSVLEASGIIYLLQPYYRNVTKRLVKTPKLYFLDTGLCSYLTKWPNPESLELGAMSGAILETYIFTEILKSYFHNGVTPHFYYYRDLDQREVDLVIETGGTFYPVEFKKTARPSRTASKHFHLLQKLGKKVGHGAVICFVEKDVPISREVTAIPVGYL
ncbi:MAG: ATP-binding protein [Pseudomonadota bacterium]